MEATEQSAAKTSPLETGKAKLTWQDKESPGAHEKRLRYLLMQRKFQAESIEANKQQQQEVEALNKFDKYCRQNPNSKGKLSFQGYIKAHNLWSYPLCKKDARWTKEQPRLINALDDKNKKVGFGIWYKRPYND